MSETRPGSPAGSSAASSSAPLGPAADAERHVRSYLIVFAALLALTVVTVAIYYVHMPPAIAIAVALAVATVKAGLVAAVFMHLLDERRLIYWLLGLTAFFLVVLLATGVLTRPASPVFPA